LSICLTTKEYLIFFHPSCLLSFSWKKFV
jgi:hypothetical protein